MFWRRGACVVLFVAGLVVPVAHATTACADSPNHAALIVDTGNGVERRCVGFGEGTITGKQLLDRANVGVVYKEYSYGAAVCSLFGVGNSADDCLGERSGNHWSYFRARKGTSMFSLASTGVSMSEVHDGDVEGWRWKTGVPPYASASDVCAPAPAPTTTAATAPSVTAPVAARVGGTLPKEQKSTDTSVTTAVTSTSVEVTTSTTGRQLALPVDDENGGSPWPLVAVGGLIVGLGIATWQISRRRAAGG